MEIYGGVFSSNVETETHHLRIKLHLRLVTIVNNLPRKAEAANSVVCFCLSLLI